MSIIVITGATGKVGSVLCQYFIDRGHIVVAIGRSSDSLLKLKETIGGVAEQLFFYLAVNLTDDNSSEQIIGFLRDRDLYPNCLINNARDSSYLCCEPNGTVSRSNFVAEFTLDVVIPYELTNALAIYSGSRLTSVVNIGSQYGIVASNLSLYTNPVLDSHLHYGVAKAALSHLTKEMAVRFAGHGLRINCVAYGGIEGRVDVEFQKRYASLCPIGRMLREHELIAPIEMLLSNAASAITGHTLVVDGGWSIW